MSLSNPNKVVTEERLNEYHNTILPYLGGMPDILANKFARGDMYSTDEKIIGRWIDGKPLYQKTFTTSTLNSTTAAGGLYSGQFVFADYIPNADLIFVDTEKSYLSMSGATCGIISAYKLNNYILFFTEVARNNFTVTMTVQYTKTTDSPVEIGIDTDYSTTEKIIGTWIDGSPLWQKTFSGKTASSTTWNTIGTLDSSVIPVNYNSFVLKSKANEYYALCGNTNYGFLLKIDTQHHLLIYTQISDFYDCDVIVTVQYTKTTD